MIEFSLDGKKIQSRVWGQTGSFTVPSTKQTFEETFKYITYAVRQDFTKEDMVDGDLTEDRPKQIVFQQLNDAIYAALLAGKYQKDEGYEINIDDNPMIVWRQELEYHVNEYRLNEDQATTHTSVMCDCRIAIIPPQSVNSVIEYLDNCGAEE